MEDALCLLRRRDPVLKQIISQVGSYEMAYHPPTFHSLVRSIVYQQLSGKAASTIFGRFQTACGVRTLKPEAVLEVSEEQMRAAGLSGQKARYVRDLALKTASGEVRFRGHKRMTDDEVIGELTKVKGVGVWTVQMFLMFALRRPDVFPVLDLGVRNGMQKVYGLSASSKPADYEAIAEKWRPYRSVGSWYMWQSLELS
ncbi:MAG: DNA-3-methyladenine glycosylase 2 family protein [Acidobacteria bacterium]|nr:DNA-3-methyladenine glycosylase 2 family protein [Acidobacteriota bacterium]